jgi:predicted metal-dependent hydrolase
LKTDTSFHVIHSRRKTIALIIGRDGKLVVRAPYHATQAQILAFIEQKAGWIHRKQSESLQRLAQTAARQFISGESFLYLGNAHPLEIVDRSHTPLSLENGQFIITKTALPRAREVFIAWYKKQALQVFEERATIFASRYHLIYQQIKITSARTRWGSCSSSSTLSFTWRLVMAPLPVIDYVIVHELAHLVEKNHSSKFWSRVAAMMSDYAKYVKWLKANGYQLTLE